MSKIPDIVWTLDDNKDRVFLIKKILNEKYKSSENPDLVKKWFDKPIFLPDLFVLDICLSDQEVTEVQTLDMGKNINITKFKSLTQVRGIQFLTWLRSVWPNLPVILISDYWNGYLPSLTQHAISIINKPYVIGFNKIVEIFWLGQETIIGVRLPKIYGKNAIKIIKKVNSAQNHFFFVLCNNEDDLIIPPRNILSKDLVENHPILIFEVWNNRILGLIEDVSLIEEDNNISSFHPLLPFSRNPLSRFNVQIQNNIEFMGNSFFEPYFLRECARVAYSLYFNIKSHPIKTGKCIFDNSSYPPDLLKGIWRGEICPECRSQMIPEHANGGWSNGRDKAANTICQMAKESLINL